ncbi:Hypothetical predicted protein [Paramuricea clavata]|uniref:Uncharacterized protein n=1 Tax=Paramuricea clavata TaxID=317549 RepID=A0A7D9E4Q0_PARCT|nr:Hypothetical predicted protein [Paramuricea clavata]
MAASYDMGWQKRGKGHNSSTGHGAAMGLATHPRVLIKRSASPLAFGQHGVIRRCWRPRCSANFLNSRLVNGGPLSLFKTSGIPCLEKIASNFGITALADVEVKISTSGKRLYSSITTMIYSPEG